MKVLIVHLLYKRDCKERPSAACYTPSTSVVAEHAPRMSCAACRGGRFWRIPRAHEHSTFGRDEPMFVAVVDVYEPPPLNSTFHDPFAVTSPARHARGGAPPSAPRLLRRERSGHFELWVCDRCGLTRWFARALRHTGSLKRTIRPKPCPECERTETFVVDPFEEDAGGGREPLRVARKGFPKVWAEGVYRLHICAPCGYVEWLAMGIDRVEPDLAHGLLAVERPRPCVCGERSFLRVETVREAGGYQLEVVPGIGSFGVDCCRACGRTDWLAQGVDRLKPDREQGIGIVERAQRPEGGPYR